MNAHALPSSSGHSGIFLSPCRSADMGNLIKEFRLDWENAGLIVKCGRKRELPGLRGA